MRSWGWFCVVVLRRGRLAARGRHHPLRGGGALVRWCALGNVARRAIGCIRLNMDILPEL